MPYSDEIFEAIAAAASRNADLPYRGRSVNFACGCLVVIAIDVDDDGTIRDVACRSNGCGYIFAAAEKLRDRVLERNTSEVRDRLDTETSRPERPECIRVVREAFDACLDTVRASRLDSYDGDSPLICSCFGVAEDDIFDALNAGTIATVEQLSEATRAGSGCGACRMVLTELLESTR